jgi:hypothetical protein
LTTTLQNGILFEESGAVLEWGTPIDKLAKTLKARKVQTGGRTIYEWGTHTILGGLKLSLTTSYLDFGFESFLRKFDAIEFWAIGDIDAEKYLPLIHSHLTEQIGPPNQKVTNAPDESYEWVVNRCRITLYFFEQHAYKLHLSIIHL